MDRVGGIIELFLCSGMQEAYSGGNNTYEEAEVEAGAWDCVVVDELDDHWTWYSGSSRRPFKLLTNSSSRADEASCNQN